jgi:hypothetical protein
MAKLTDTDARVLAARKHRCNTVELDTFILVNNLSVK